MRSSDSRAQSGWSKPRPFAWTWLVVVSSLFVCAAITWVHVSHRRTIEHAVSLVENIRTARVDLSRGFLHVMLGNEPDSPFSRSEGLALLNQSIESLHRAVATAKELRVIGANEASLTARFDQSVDHFRKDLALWESFPGRDPRTEVEFRVAFARLDRQAARIDTAIREGLERRSSDLERDFQLDLFGAILLLGVICAGAYSSSRGYQRAVAALGESEERLRSLGDNLPDIYVFQYTEEDGRRRFLYVSAGVERVHGAKPEEVLADADVLFSTVDPEYAALMDHASDASRRDLLDFTVEVPFLHANGERRWLAIRSRPRLTDSGGVIWDGIAADITKQFEAEEALRERDQLLQEMSAMAHIGGWSFDPATGEGEWTEEVARIHDFDPKAETSRDVGLSVYRGESLERIQSAILLAIEEREPYDLELEMTTPAGARKWVRTKGVPVVRDGRVVRLRGSIQDITDLKIAEGARQESEDRLRQLAENIVEVMWLLDLGTSRLLYMSPAYETVFGRTVESLMEDPARWMTYIHADDYEAVARLMREVLSGQAETMREVEFRISRPDGEIRWLRGRVFPVRDAKGRVYRLAGIGDDVTERKQLEAQFLRSQRLEALGRLASGVAHDLNNVLMPILSGAEHLNRTLESTKSRQAVAIIQRSARRGADMIRQLLTFAKGGEGSRGIAHPGELLGEIGKVIRASLPSTIDISSNVVADGWNVNVDSTQLHQVLMNLCVNARDAMPDGGTLEITCQNEILGPSDASNLGVEPGPYVLLRVADSGEGIPREVLDRIFEPFFTTKEPGKGTGLGLSVVIGIIEAHGGAVRVTSEAGHGTTFSIYLPAVAGDAGVDGRFFQATTVP